MNIFREVPPTAGFPLFAKDFLSLLIPKNRKGSLEEDFKNYLKVGYARITCSGTAAFYLILEGLKQLSAKKTVIIPSYICPLLPLAIKRAGLKVEVCDINRDDFNFNLRELEDLCSRNNDALAVVPTHLAGIPLDFEAVEKIVKRYGIFIIEDCAQSLGATYKGKKVGSLGDFAFFSLCRGKGLTIYEGGVLIANRKEYFAAIDRKIKELVEKNFFCEGLKVFELFGYWIFYRPFLFWFVFRLPQLFWDWQGKPYRALAEYFTLDFPVHQVSKIRKLIGCNTFNRLDREINRQRQKALFYIERLSEIKGVRVIQEGGQARATYPYLTLVFDDVNKRTKALRSLKHSGLGASIIYTQAITDYDYLKNTVPAKTSPAAGDLAKRQMTLSTSAFLEKKDLESVVQKIKNL